MKTAALFRLLSVLCLLSSLAACAEKSPLPPPPAPAPAAQAPTPAVPQDWRRPVFLYATNRNPREGVGGSAQFGGLRARQMAYGELRTTASGGQADGSDLYQVNVNLDKVTRLGHAGFVAEVERAAARTPGREVLVFIHGFDNGFEDAARTAARVSIGVGFTGATVLFSWPSAGSPAAYLSDRNNAYFAVHALKGLLRDLTASPWVGRVAVVAHSMGNEVFIRACAELAGECRGEAGGCAALRKLRTMVLAAPDVDREIFLDQHASRLTGLDARVVLYTSRGDVALAASALVQGGDYERLGKNVACIPGVEVTDVSDVKTDVLGHSWISQSRAVLKDLRCALTEGCDRFGAGVLREMSCLPGMRAQVAGREGPARQTYWKLVVPGQAQPAPTGASFGLGLPSFLKN